jgi:predicted site-specific integrase-resolvase
MTRKQAKEPFEHERWLTPAEVAVAFAVGPKTVTRWAKNGTIPGDVVRWTPSGHRRYEEGGIRALLTAGRPS